MSAAPPLVKTVVPAPSAEHAAQPSAGPGLGAGRSGGAPVPDPLTMGQRFLPEAPTSRIVLRLHALLCAIAPDWPLTTQLDWLEQLSSWLHRHGWPRSSRHTSLNLLQDNDPRTLHLQLLVNVLTHVPAWRAAFSALMRAVLGQMQATRLFSDIGLPQEPGFWSAAPAEAVISPACGGPPRTVIPLRRRPASRTRSAPVDDPGMTPTSYDGGR